MNDVVEEAKKCLLQDYSLDRIYVDEELYIWMEGSMTCSVGMDCGECEKYKGCALGGWLTEREYIRRSKKGIT